MQLGEKIVSDPWLFGRDGSLMDLMVAQWPFATSACSANNNVPQL